jgi:hypothetical protein
MESLPTNLNDKAQAYAFRQLISHLQAHPQVQTMEMMTVAGFCRNC